MTSFTHLPANATRPGRPVQSAGVRTEAALEREAQRMARRAAEIPNAHHRDSWRGGVAPVTETGPLTGGEPLPESARRRWEPMLGYDFGRVRVHRDADAATAVRSLDARAYTVGSHIVFGEGRFAPSSRAGMQLIGHELTHVAQQAGGPTVVQCDKDDPKKKPDETAPPPPVATTATVDPADQEITRQETALKGMKSFNAGTRVGKGTADTVEALIESSRLLRPFIRSKVATTQVKKDFTIYDFDVQFESKQGELEKVVTPNTGGSRKSANVAYGFYHRNTDSIHLRPDANLAHALHEAIHKYSSAGLQSILGIFTNEGITQRFTDLVLAEHSVTGKSSHAYGDQLAAANVLAGWFTADELAAAFFEGSGMTEFDERVRQELGIDTPKRMKLAAGSKGKDLADKIMERKGKPSRATPRQPKAPPPAVAPKQGSGA